MAQFDVYKNPNKATKNLFPLLLDIQHEVISELATRIVIPLGIASHFQNETLTRLMPEVEFDGLQLVILTPQISAVAANRLKKPIGTLEHLRFGILGSLDFAVSGI